MSKDRNLAALLVERAPKHAIQNFLRKKKAEGRSVKITAKEDGTLAGNIAEALSSQQIHREEVLRLISECEENGDQHVFFYDIPEGALWNRLKDPAKVALDIFDPDFDFSSFPKFTKPTKDLTCIDFRKETTSNLIWTAKLHREEQGYRNTGEKRQLAGTNKYNQVIESYEYRVVFVVRVLRDRKLEIRIGRSGNTSAKLMNDRLEAVWEVLRGAVKPTQLTEWDLNNSRVNQLKNFIENFTKIDLPFAVKGCILEDKDEGNYDIKKSNGGITSAITRHNINHILTKTESCRALVVTLKKDQSRGALRNDLRIVMGGHNSHEILIGSQIDAAGFDYVTSHIRRFNEGAS